MAGLYKDSVSSGTDNQNEQIEFVFQMYGKQDLYGGGTNLKVKLTGDGMERKSIPVEWCRDHGVKIEQKKKITL